MRPSSSPQWLCGDMPAMDKFVEHSVSSNTNKDVIVFYTSTYIHTYIHTFTVVHLSYLELYTYTYIYITYYIYIYDIYIYIYI